MAFSSQVRAHLDGGIGNDGFSWGGSDVPTWADGGPGDDRFNARNGRGPDTISGGDGVDAIDVFDRRAAKDTVTCGAGLDALTADTVDVRDRDCETAPTAPVLGRMIEADARAAQRTLRRTPLSTLASRGLVLPIGGRFAATYSAQLYAPVGGRFRRVGLATRTVTRPGRFRLRLRLTRSGRALAARAPRLRVRLFLNDTVPIPAPWVGRGVSGASPAPRCPPAERVAHRLAAPRSVPFANTERLPHAGSPRQRPRLMRGRLGHFGDSTSPGARRRLV